GRGRRQGPRRAACAHPARRSSRQGTLNARLAGIDVVETADHFLYQTPVVAGTPEETAMDRRNALKMSVLASIGLATAGKASAQPGCAGDGTPAQFTPRTAPDPQPQVDDLARYPKCPYCGMDRKQYHHSRMVVH